MTTTILPARNHASVEQVWLLFVVATAGSWAIWLWPVDPRRIVYVTLFGVTLQTSQSFLQLVIGNCLPGVFAVAFAAATGKATLRQLRSTLTNWHAPIKWYALAFMLPTTVFLVSLWAASFLVSATFRWPPMFTPFRIFVITLPLGTLWEEIAWRAYALPRLTARFSRVSAALLLGAYWSTWHIPLWLITLHLTPHNRLSVLCIAFLNLTAWSVIFAFFYEKSGQSLPVTIALHGAYGAISTYVAAVAPQTNLHVIVIVTLLSGCVASILGARMTREEANARADWMKASAPDAE